jgi:anti-anti-sigma regulatory factor
MAMIASWLKIDGEHLVQHLQDARDRLNTADGELVLDFASVRRIDPSAVKEMETLASVADEKSVKVVLRGVNVEVYKVLKFVRLARRFSFVG